jgi:hypothetical protein
LCETSGIYVATSIASQMRTNRRDATISLPRLLVTLPFAPPTSNSVINTLSQHTYKSMSQLHTRVLPVPLPVFRRSRTSRRVDLDQPHVSLSLINGCMVHAVVSVAEIMHGMSKLVLTCVVDNDDISFGVMHSGILRINVGSVLSSHGLCSMRDVR